MTASAFEPCPLQAADDHLARFERVYRRNFSDIYAYCFRRANGDEVADLVSEVFLIAWRRLDDLPSFPEDRLWLYGVARRVVSQHVRTLQRRKRLISKIVQDHRPGNSQESGLETTLTSRVQDLVDALRPKDREIVSLLVWERLSPAEAALVLGCSVNAVNIRWHRALKQLRRRMVLPSVASTERRAGGM